MNISSGINKNKRKDGRFMGWVSVSGKRQYFYDTYKQELKRKISDFVETLDTGINLTDMTLAEYSEMFLKRHEKEYAPTTFAQYEIIHRVHLLPSPMADKPMAELKHSDFQVFLGNFEKSRKTAVNVMCYFRTLYTDAVQDKLLAYNPVEGKFRYKQTKAYDYYIYTPEEMATLFGTYDKDDKDLTAIMLAALCGLRLSECMGLQFSKIDFNNNMLTIDTAAVFTKDGVHIKPPKTVGSQRKLYMPPILAEQLKYHCRNIKSPNAFIFSDDNGLTPMNGFYVSMRFLRHQKKHKLPHTRFHDLRHFSATSLMGAGLPDKQIAQYLGHTNTQTTKRYEHILANMQHKPAEVFDTLFPKK